MKNLILFLLTFLAFASCKDENRTQFERNLPEGDLVVLNELIDSFDQFINRKYDGDVKRYLQDVVNRDTIFTEQDTEVNCDLLCSYNESTLEIKSERLDFDTVFASHLETDFNGNKRYSEELSIVSVKQNGDTTWGELIIAGNAEQTLENQILEKKKYGYWKLISASSFLKALENTEIRNKDVKNYIEGKQEEGEIYPQRLASETLHFDIDVDDYFIRRILVLEVFINKYKQEKRC